MNEEDVLHQDSELTAKAGEIVDAAPETFPAAVAGVMEEIHETYARSPSTAPFFTEPGAPAKKHRPGIWEGIRLSVYVVVFGSLFGSEVLGALVACLLIVAFEGVVELWSRKDPETARRLAQVGRWVLDVALVWLLLGLDSPRLALLAVFYLVATLLVRLFMDLSSRAWLAAWYSRPIARARRSGQRALAASAAKHRRREALAEVAGLRSVLDSGEELEPSSLFRLAMHLPETSRRPALLRELGWQMKRGTGTPAETRHLLAHLLEARASDLPSNLGLLRA